MVQIGTIVSDAHIGLNCVGKRESLRLVYIKIKKGGFFIWRLFYEIFQIKNMEVIVKKSNSKEEVAIWMGGRMSLVLTRANY